MTVRGRLAVMAALGPVVAVAAASVAAVFGAAMGSPFWGPQPETLPEAVAVRDRGEIARLIGLGANPNARDSVRAGLMDSVDLRLTPLEAAVGIGRPDLIVLLQDFGAAADAGEMRTLRCYADFRRSEARSLLLSLSSEPWPDCRHVTLPNQRP